jgi:hypothetical protein
VEAAHQKKPMAAKRKKEGNKFFLFLRWGSIELILKSVRW